MTNRMAISLLIYGLVQAVLFGVGMIAIVVTPLSNYAIYSIPAVVLLSALIAVPVAWKVAPIMRARHQRRLAREGKLGDPTPQLITSPKCRHPL